MAHRSFRWIVLEPDQNLCQSLSEKCGLIPEAAKVLVNRGVSTEKDVDQFLNPTLKELADPFDLAGLKSAVEKIISVLDEGGHILIHGDYDADGISASSLLYDFFMRLKADVSVYIPNRLEEGHGIGPASIETAKKRGASLVLTCDCGISNMEEVAELKQAGIDTIITDHHMIPQGGAPKDAIVVDPQLPDCQFKDKGISGVGVAFYLVMGLRKTLREKGAFSDQGEPNLLRYLDLVALGTIADVSELRGQNRILVRFGLKEIAKTSRLGLRSLIRIALRPEQATIDTIPVAFYLAPKINAAGRLGRVTQAFDLLTTVDSTEADRLARDLVGLNEERQRIERKILAEAKRLATEQFQEKGENPALVLSSSDWHPGVIGIVAQKLVEQYQVPVILLSDDGEVAKGSGRSVEGFDLVETIGACSELLLTHGGHRMAAGVTLSSKNVTAFVDCFSQEASKRLKGVSRDKTMKIDATISLEAVSEKLLDQLEKIKPFGNGNPKPIFATYGAKILKKSVVGKDHLKLTVTDDSGQMRDAIGFGMGELFENLSGKVDLAYSPEFNVWRGSKNIQLKLEDLRDSSI